LWLISAVPSLLILAIPAGLIAHATTQTIRPLIHHDPLPHLLDLTLNALLLYLAYLLTPHPLTLHLRLHRLLLPPSDNARLPTRPLIHNDPLPHLLDLTLNALLTYLAYLLTPHALTLYLRFNRLLLAPSEKARLTARVRHLATSRANTIDTQASEIRRIERDLHDGAQARLVALGMHLGMAEQIITQDPNTARTMLTEARETTRQALTELRDLVRGIHPPVLVERGLHGAVHALALT